MPRILRLLRLLRVNEDINQRDLAIKIIKAIPLVVPIYIKGISFSFDPRPSVSWISQFSFLQHLLTVLKEDPLPKIDINGNFQGMFA